MVAEPPQQVQLRCPPYFAALSRIDACRGIARPRPGAHFHEYPGAAIDGDNVDLARTVAHIARGDAQAPLAQEVAYAVFGRRTALLRRAAAYGAGTVPLRPGRPVLQAMLPRTWPAAGPRGGALRAAGPAAGCAPTGWPAAGLRKDSGEHG